MLPIHIDTIPCHPPLAVSHSHTLLCPASVAYPLLSLFFFFFLPHTLFALLTLPNCVFKRFPTTPTAISEKENIEILSFWQPSEFLSSFSLILPLAPFTYLKYISTSPHLSLFPPPFQTRARLHRHYHQPSSCLPFLSNTLLLLPTPNPKDLADLWISQFVTFGGTSP